MIGFKYLNVMCFVFQPAYQNLTLRVQGAVEQFLSSQKWTPDLNKNQLRESLRRHLNE